jgi:hypothetical protein
MACWSKSTPLRSTPVMSKISFGGMDRQSNKGASA